MIDLTAEDLLEFEQLHPHAARFFVAIGRETEFPARFIPGEAMRKDLASLGIHTPWAIEIDRAEDVRRSERWRMCGPPPDL